jgi:hypothetical protein
MLPRNFKVGVLRALLSNYKIFRSVFNNIKVVLLYSAVHFCAILTKFGVCRQIFGKESNIETKTHPVGNAAVTFGQTDGRKLRS